jgi:hypothetical protein
MEVTIATVLLIAISWRMRRVTAPGDGVAAGLLLAALVLTRFSFLPIAVGGVVLAGRAGVIRASVVGLTLLAGIAPWMVYCQVMSGAPLPSRLGENLFVSTSAIAETVVPEINVDVLVPVANDMVQEELNRRGVRESDEAERDRILLRFALDYVRAHPMTALRMKLRNLAYILQPRLLPFFDRVGTASIVDGRLSIPPQRRRPLGFEIVSAAFQSLLLVGGVAGLVVRRAQWGNDAFLLLVAASVIAINAIFFPTSRLLAPMTFVLMFYAAVAIDRILPAARPGLTLNASSA